MLRAGMELCIGIGCETYQVGSGETCENLVASLASVLNEQQLLAWNPNINPLCSNLHDIPGMVVCIG
jgi:hypothetical protein